MRTALPRGTAPVLHAANVKGTISARKTAHTLKKSHGWAHGPPSRPQLLSGGEKCAQNGRARSAAKEATPKAGRATLFKNAMAAVANPGGRVASQKTPGRKIRRHAYTGVDHPLVIPSAPKKRPASATRAVAWRRARGASRSRVTKRRRTATKAALKGRTRTCACRSAKRKLQNGYSSIAVGGMTRDVAQK